MANKKKNFDQIGEMIQNATGTKQNLPTADESEKKTRAEALKTQGKKGCKAVRINMAFTPSNHDFICVMSKINGMTLTAYCNAIVEEYRKEHSDLYDQAKAVLDLANK